MPKCNKCGLNLYKCDLCKGEGSIADFANRMVCSKCKGKTMLCPTHKENWG